MSALKVLIGDDKKEMCQGRLTRMVEVSLPTTINAGSSRSHDPAHYLGYAIGQALDPARAPGRVREREEIEADRGEWTIFLRYGVPVASPDAP